MNATAIYTLGLAQLPAQLATLMQQHVLGNPAPVLPLDTKSFLFAREHKLPCLTLLRILGEECITQCQVEGAELGSAWAAGLEAQYTHDDFFPPKLVFWRMSMLFTHLLLMEKVHVALSAQGLNPVFPDTALNSELGEYAFYGPSLRYLGMLCHMPLAAVPEPHLPPPPQQDQPLLEEARALRGHTLLAVEQDEMPRFLATRNILENAGMPVTPIMFPYEGTTFSADAASAASAEQQGVLRLRPPASALQANFFGAFSETYPGSCPHPLVHRVWSALRHIFYHLHAVYFPWLVRYRRLWTQLLHEAMPRAVITSLVQYPVSALPGSAARPLGIPALGISHSIFQSVFTATAPEYSLTNYPQWHKHFLLLGLKSHLVRTDTPLLHIQQETQPPTQHYKKKSIIILTAAADRFDLIHHSSFDFYKNCLMQLKKLPPHMADSLEIKIKWHPFDGDCGMRAFCPQKPWFEIIPHTAQLEPYLENAWMVIGLEYMTSGLLNALSRGIPTVFWGLDRWKVYANINFSLPPRSESWYWEYMRHISQPDQLLPFIDACLNTEGYYEQFKQDAATAQKKLMPASTVGESLPEIIRKIPTRQKSFPQ